MSTIILLAAAIGIFVTFVLALSFPQVTTLFYQFWREACNFIMEGTGVLWLFVPQQLAVTLVSIIIAMEVIYRAILIFIWIYNKIRP